MATTRNLYCIDFPKSTQLSTIRCTDHPKEKSPKTVAAQSEIGNLAGLELQGQFISDKGDELRVRGFFFGIVRGISAIKIQKTWK